MNVIKDKKSFQLCACVRALAAVRSAYSSSLFSCIIVEFFGKELVKTSKNTVIKVEINNLFLLSGRKIASLTKSN